jgi:hypothetical protein
MATLRNCVCIYDIALNSSKYLKFTYPIGFNPPYTGNGIRTLTPSRLFMSSPENRLPSPSSSFSPHYSSPGTLGVRNPLKKSPSSPKNVKTSPSSLKKPTSVFGSIPGSGPESGFSSVSRSGSVTGFVSGCRPGYGPGSGSGSSTVSGCSSFDHGVYDNGVYDTKYGLSKEDTDINPIRNYDLYDKKYGSSCREEIGVFERGNRDEIGVFDSDLLRDGEDMGRDRSQDKERDRERFLGSSGGIGGSAMLSQQSPLQVYYIYVRICIYIYIQSCIYIMCVCTYITLQLHIIYIISQECLYIYIYINNNYPLYRLYGLQPRQGSFRRTYRI